MGTGAITQYVDVAQLVLYLFWIFFAGLIYYLVREGHREGYPMETESGRGQITGWPLPQPKTYLLPHGGEASFPNDKVSPQQLLAEPSHRWTGAPMVPTGNPMLDGVGPGAYADRADVRILEIDCDLGDDYLIGHAIRVGLAGPQTSPDTFARLLPTIRRDMIHDRDAIRDARFKNAARLRETATDAENAAALAAFLGVDDSTALGLAQTPHLFVD